MKKQYIQPEIIVLGYEAQSFCGLSIRTPKRKQTQYWWTSGRR